MEIQKRKGKQVGRLTVFEGDTASIELVLQIVLEKPTHA